MTTFTWKPIYAELAHALLAFKHRQPDLIDILAEIGRSKPDVPIIRLVDAPKPATAPKLTTIDPFTFFASFNRGLTEENRIHILHSIKARLHLSNGLPTDFAGIPVVDKRGSWFFPYPDKRKPDDIVNLWNLAEAVVQKGPAEIDPLLFDQCLAIHTIGPAKLTMGLFWLSPDKYLALDDNNLSYFRKAGITTQVTDHASYVSLLKEIREKFPQDFAQISRSAWEAGKKLQPRVNPTPVLPKAPSQSSSLKELLKRYHTEHILFVDSAHNRRYAVQEVDGAGVYVERIDGEEVEHITFAHGERALQRLHAEGSLEFISLDSTAAARNTILQAEPLALTADRSHVVFLSDSQSRLQNFLEVLDAMKRENRLYKPAMLLAVLEAIDSGELLDNQIPFDWIAPRFIAAMKSLGETVTEREAAQPFYHLSNDLFWLHAVFNFKDLMESGGDGPSAARKKIKYALLKDTYWNLLQDPASRAAVRRKLEQLMLPESDKILLAAEKAFEPTGFVRGPDLLRRFLSALAAKPFVILTGTSGTGKTQLAKLVAEWLSQSSIATFRDPFMPGAVIASDKVSYYVHKADKDSVEFWNNKDEGSATKVSLPRQMILEWTSEMTAQKFDADTPARKIREAVTPKSKFSSQLHSFETHLKAAALAVLGSPGSAPNQAALPETYAIVPVGADWTDNRNVVGFVNHLRKDEQGNPTYSSTPVLDLLLRATGDSYRPYFLILDEMNLSHVERYFADFLSAMESKKSIPLHSERQAVLTPAGDPVPNSIIFPDNLFVIGTVNVDETTYMFSPKVLDRANVIEFRIDPTSAAKFLKRDGTSASPIESSHWMAMAFLELSRRARGLGTPLPAPEVGVLKSCTDSLGQLFDLLHTARLEFAFRTITEITRYLHVDFALTAKDAPWEWEKCMDAQILQKLLPKLHGSRRRLEAILIALATHCEARDLGASQKRLERDNELSSYPPATEPSKVAFPLSRSKLIEMLEAVRRDQFVSFIQ